MHGRKKRMTSDAGVMGTPSGLLSCYSRPLVRKDVKHFESVEAKADYNRGTQRQFSENICSEDDLSSRIFGTFVLKFLACLPLLGFSKSKKMV